MATVLAVTTDEHVNCRAGLCYVQVVLQDKRGRSLVLPTKTQIAVRNAYERYWDRVEAVAEECKAPVIWIDLGDAVDIHAKDRLQPISFNSREVLDHAERAYQRPVSISKQRFFVHGTEVHGGPHCLLEDDLAERLGGTPCPEDGSPAWWWLPLEVEGVRIDCAHHPKFRSRLEWGMDGAAEREAAHTIMQYAARGERPPHLVLRGHVHTYADSGNRLPTRALYLDGWQALTPYVRSKGYTATAAVGGLIIVCDDGRYKEERVWWEARRPQPWKVSLK